MAKHPLVAKGEGRFWRCARESWAPLGAGGGARGLRGDEGPCGSFSPWVEERPGSWGILDALQRRLGASLLGPLLPRAVFLEAEWFAVGAEDGGSSARGAAPALPLSLAGATWGGALVLLQPGDPYGAASAVSAPIALAGASAALLGLVALMWGLVRLGSRLWGGRGTKGRSVGSSPAAAASGEAHRGLSAAAGAAPGGPQRSAPRANRGSAAAA